MLVLRMNVATKSLKKVDEAPQHRLSPLGAGCPAMAEIRAVSLKDL